MDISLNYYIRMHKIIVLYEIIHAVCIYMYYVLCMYVCMYVMCSILIYSVQCITADYMILRHHVAISYSTLPY